MRQIKAKVKSKKAKAGIRYCVFFLTAACCLFTFDFRVRAHEGKLHNFADLLYTWSFDPLIVATLALSAWIYIQGVFNLWRAGGRGKGIKVWEAAAFAGGWISLVIALVSPLHPWGASLFSAHMTQHEVLILVAAPLFALSRPLIATLWAMPKSWRRGTKNFINEIPRGRAAKVSNLNFYFFLIPQQSCGEFNL